MDELHRLYGGMSMSVCVTNFNWNHFYLCDPRNVRLEKKNAAAAAYNSICIFSFLLPLVWSAQTFHFN